jgi:hypothetical protein
MERSEELVVNGIRIYVTDYRRFKDEIPEGWRILARTNIAYYMPDGREMLIAGGYDASKIDFAVPQSWWEEQKRKTGEAPRACWSYEDGSIFGKPLPWSDVVWRLERALYEAWIESYEEE